MYKKLKEERKMRKIIKLAYALAMFIVLTICCHTTCFASNEYNNGTYRYTVDFYNNSCTITKYLGNDAEVNIPNSIDGYRVEAIGKSCFGSNEKVAKVTIPHTVMSIGTFAFQHSGLTEITIPSNVTFLGQCVFDGCSKLKKVVYEAHTTELPGGSFDDCVNLESITLSNTITKIGSAFKNCKKLRFIFLPNQVTEIGSSCFSGCISLESFSFPPLVKGAYAGVLRGCTSLKTVNLNNCEYIGQRAFAGCTNLREIRIPISVDWTYQSAFEDCCNLEKVYIYNPKMDIMHFTFDVTSKLTLFGYTDSTTQKYAKEYGIRFNSLGYFRQPVTSITLGAKAYNKTVGDVWSITANVRPNNAANKSLEWTSSNPEVAAVNSSGKVKARAVGTTTIIVSAKDGSGKKDICTVTIVPKKMEILSLKTSGSKKLKVCWKKQVGVTGYQIQYSTKSDFKGSKTKSVSNKKTEITLTGLRANKTYYVRIRAYKNVGNKAYNGSWSTKKKIKTR